MNVSNNYATINIFIIINDINVLNHIGYIVPMTSYIQIMMLYELSDEQNSLNILCM